MEKCQRLAAASVFSALVSLEAGRSFSALLSEASVFDSLVDADALEAELEECSELLPEVLWDELELPEEAASSLDEAEESDVLPEEAPDEDELPELEELEDELLLDVLELDDSLLTVKVSVLLFTVQSL